MNMVKVVGGCHCGAVQFEAETSETPRTARLQLFGMFDDGAFASNRSARRFRVSQG